MTRSLNLAAFGRSVDSSGNAPLITGGSDVSSTLTLQSTTGVGSSDAIQFKVGNNGATTAMTINTSGNVGIGTSSPTVILDVYSATSATAFLRGDSSVNFLPQRSSTDAVAPFFTFRKSRGTTASPTAVSSGDNMGQLLFSAYGGTNWRSISSVRSYVDTYTSDTDISSYLTFYTSPTGGVAQSERMRIDSSGNVGIGTNANNRLSFTYNGGTGAATIGPNSTSGSTYLTFGTSSSGTYSEAMRIDSSGRVGIGTSTPAAGYSLTANGSTIVGNGTDITPTASWGGQLTISGSGYSGGLAMDASGIWLGHNSASRAVIFATDETERMRISSSGNVGVGTTSPAYKLSIQVSAGTTSFYTTDAATSDLMITPGISSGVVRVGPVSGAMALYTANTERMRIDSSGNVGIGTANPQAVLDLGNSTAGRAITWGGPTGTQRYSSIFSAYSSGALVLATNTTGSTSTDTYVSTYTGTVANNLIRLNVSGTGGIQFFTDGNSAQTAGSAFVPTERMRIDSSGNVGIGTTSPSSYYGQLVVYGNPNSWQANFVSSGTAQYTGSYIGLTTANASSNYGQTVFLHAFNTGPADTTDTSFSIQQRTTGSSFVNTVYNVSYKNQFQSWYTSGSERMRLDSSGNLQVNTTNSGAAGTTCRFTINDGSTYAPFGINNNAAGTAASNVCIFARNGTIVGTISVTGSATSYNTSSDYRLKENVLNLLGGVETIQKLRPVSYTWKEGYGNGTGEGFIAHELAEHIPLAVTGEKDAVDEEGNIKPQGVDYSKIVVHLVAAMQEQQAQITSLKAELDAVKQEFNNYKSSHP